MNKNDLIQKIKQLDGISDDERAYLINLVNTKKKYGLVWEDKPEDVEEQLRTQLPVLREVVEKRILSKDLPIPEITIPKAKDASLFENEEITDEYNASPLERSGVVANHILIEGDNLHALTALSFTHEGAIDLIYIDPPYNTGNKDFYYHDDYVYKEDGYRHSKWLSYMHKRLSIAKRLLSENGLIFISIDDNEQSQLKLLCDEIFSEKNFVNNICQKSRHSISNDLIISENHNFLLFYTNNFQNTFNTRKEFRLKKEIDFKLFKNPDKDPKGAYKIHPVDGPGGAKKGNPYYEFMGITGYWRYSKETMQQYYDEGEIVVRKNTLGRKYYLSKAILNNYEAVTTWWDDVGTTTEGTKALKDIIVDCDFNNPKPLRLLERILKLSTNNKSSYTILDFFAGSGTTLHATMQLNAEDGGNRQCIMVTNNENNICEEVTYERNKRVLKGYTNAKGVEVSGLTNNNLRYYKTDFVSSVKNEQNKRLLTQASTDLLCIKEDCYTDITLLNNFNPAQCRIFNNDSGKFMIVVYHSRKMTDIIDQLVIFIKELNNLSDKVKLYAFSPEKETLLEDFWEVADKIDAVPLPEATYNAYRATFRTIKLDKKPISKISKLESDQELTEEFINQDVE